MAQPQDRTPSTVAPEGETRALYENDDNLDLDAGARPHDGDLDHAHGAKTRRARKDEISRRPV